MSALPLILLLIASRRPEAFQPIDRAQRAAIEKAVDLANREQQRVNELRSDIKLEVSRIDPDRAKLDSWLADLRERKTINDFTHAEAIRLAVEGFGLAPTKSTALNKDRDGPYGGVGVKWRIGFRDGTYEYSIADSGGMEHSDLYKSKDFHGIAFADGQIFISPRAFQSPAFLAAVILHERIHYDQYTEPDGPNGHRPDLGMRELFARQAVLARRELLGLSKEEVAALDEDLSQRYQRLTTVPWSKALRHSVAADKDANALEDERLSAATVDWGAQCGMTWTRTPKTKFKHPQHDTPLYFRFRDADGARAAFLLTGACLDPDADSPCIDGMDSVELRWDDAEFRESLLLAEGPDDVIWCIRHIHDHYRAGTGFGGVRQQVADYRRARKAEGDAEYRRYQERERDATRREWQRRQDEEQERRERDVERQMRHQPKNVDREWSDELQRWIIRVR